MVMLNLSILRSHFLFYLVILLTVYQTILRWLFENLILDQLKGSEQERPLDFSAIFESLQK